MTAESAQPKTELDQKPEGGWAFPTGTAKKPHFFPALGERSLCGRYVLILVPPGFEFDPDTGKTGPTDCAACARKLEASR